MAEDRTTSAGQMRLVAIIVLGLLAIVLAVQNRQSVETKFLVFSATMPRWALILGTGVAGFVAGWLAGRFRRGRK
jgi:uncharacterized integral membrane protein